MLRPIAALTTLLPTLALPQAGTLDPTFGSNGVVIVESGSPHYFEDAVVLPDGRIMAAGTVSQNPGFGGVVLRLMPNGDPDSTLAGTGIFFHPPGAQTSYGGAAVMEDGRMLLAGSNDGAFSVERRFADASLDTSFGIGGMVTVAYEGLLGCAMDVHRASSGDIIAGGTWDPIGGGPGHTVATARFTEDGTLVEDGYFPVSPQGSTARAMVVQPADGHIILCGADNLLASASMSTIIRRTDVGTWDADSTFNGTGNFIHEVLGMPHSQVNDVTLDDQGRILACGWYSPFTSAGDQEGFVMRLLSNGTLDPTFGDDGITTADLPTSNMVFTGLCVLADGHVAVSGTCSLSGSPTERLCAVLFDGAGEHVTSFGDAGSFVFMSGSYSRGGTVVQQPDGKLVLTGHGDFPGPYRLYVMRLEYEGFNTGQEALPEAAHHLSVWPNPAKEHAWLQLELRGPERADITIFDVLGRPVAVLLKGTAISGGRHTLAIPTADLAPGPYTLVYNSATGAMSTRFMCE